ncbi:hypothetical protein [Desulfoluna spongiiphila]|uniref:hypothetical protein n=1 Tax=Desulfoluna spongiiphila TaxID=419481 RepID=UPI0011139A7C|nr:hypothetical protein [Desulfoluna spongiiphila]
MAQQKYSSRNVKEILVVVFVLLGSLLVMVHVGKNLMDELRETSHIRTPYSVLVTPQPKSRASLSLVLISSL